MNVIQSRQCQRLVKLDTRQWLKQANRELVGVDGDSQQGTEISHLMMMHADEYNEDELRVICHHAACEIDRLRAELEKAKAQAVPEG
ncbi:hypothetical protein, partial [Streptococcus agalactiae]|uniref:hypothetical protein n=1 Tax=Streptococcus agalactiae TaxID=1311 RepID=UPI001C60845E